MYKTRKILSFVDNGKAYSVVKYYGDVNPYRIYHIYNDYDKTRRLKEHKKLMVKYASLASCFYWFLQNNIGY